MRVLVTGGAGRLGSWVGRELRDHGDEVVSVDRQLPSVREPGIHHRQVEMADLGQIIGAATGCDALIHLAAIPAPYSHPDEVVFLNRLGRFRDRTVTRRALFIDVVLIGRPVPIGIVLAA